MLNIIFIDNTLKKKNYGRLTLNFKQLNENSQMK